MVTAGLTEVRERSEAGGPQLDESSGERVELVQPNVRIVVGNDVSSDDPGTLYITTRKLLWLSDRDPYKGYAVDFLSLAMHAISRDTEAYPLPCIYTQIESGLGDEYNTGEDEDDESDELRSTNSGDLSNVSEMRLVPGDSNTLENIFQVLCACAALNPDPEGEQEGEGEWFFNADEVLSGGLANVSILNHHNNAEGVVQDSRFEDAEEELEDR